MLHAAHRSRARKGGGKRDLYGHLLVHRVLKQDVRPFRHFGQTLIATFLHHRSLAGRNVPCVPGFADRPFIQYELCACGPDVLHR